jgi:hypothetical protein
MANGQDELFNPNVGHIPPPTQTFHPDLRHLWQGGGFPNNRTPTPPPGYVYQEDPRTGRSELIPIDQSAGYTGQPWWMSGLGGIPDVSRGLPTAEEMTLGGDQDFTAQLSNYVEGGGGTTGTADRFAGEPGPSGGRKSFPTLPAEPSPLDKWNEELLGRDITIQTPFGTMTGGGGDNAKPLTPMEMLMTKALTPPSLKSQLIPAGIAAGTSLLGAWLGSRSANKAAEIQDRQFQEQMAMLREDRARQRALEDWEIQVAHEREKQIGGPLKQAQAAAIPGYAEHFGLDLDPEKFVTPDLDPRFTGETRPLTASEMAPPGYVLDASGNPVLPSNQQKSSKLSKLLKYGLPAAAIAMPALGAMGVPGMGWASKLAGSLAGLFRRGGDQSVSTSWTAQDPTTGLPMNQVLPSTPIQYPGIPTGLPDMGYRRPAPRSYSPFEPQLDRLPLRNE